jgi:hypothetical protein
MTAIGGFLPLEASTSSTCSTYHAGGAALVSGRACFHAILRTVKPRRVVLPFYVCDAVVQPLHASRTPFEFYSLDDAFRPAIDLQPSSGELALVVNYFGVQSAFVASLSERLGDRLVVDDTQAFFRRGVQGIWSFNSARKFFGVPDGGFLYGAVAGIGELPPSDSGDCDHLVARRAGDDADAWEQFKRHEARVSVEPRRMSDVTDRLLRAVDMERAKRARQRNFAGLHAALAALNTIALPLDGAAVEAPMCYPFLPAADVDREKLAAAGLFVPTLWPEIDSRPHVGFAWERLVARRLLPLPIDHRYGAADMDTIVQRLHQVLR